MKNYSLLVAAVIAQAPTDDRKVPPRHPLNRLKRLVQFGQEWVEDNIPNIASVRQGKWQQKWENNAQRMRDAFDRCGGYDKDNEAGHGAPPRSKRETDSAKYELEFQLERYARGVPMLGIKQITTGFRKWAERYLINCRGQQRYNHQAVRMSKWLGLLRAHCIAQDSCDS